MTQELAIPAPAPPRLLNILAIEDSPYDAELLLQELRHAGLKVRMDVAKTAVEVAAFLLGGSYDLVLSDFGLKGWTGLDALHLLRERQPDLPFILVTGSLGDEKAAECIKLGATDFVLKDRLNRLPYAVTRALEEKAQREQKRAAEVALRESEDRFRRLVEISPEAIFVGCRGQVVFINPAGMRLFGAQDESQVVGKTVANLVHPDFQQIVYRQIEQHEGTDSIVPDEEMRFRRLDGTFVDVEVSATPFQWKGRASLQVVARDITQRKRAEEALRSSEASLRDFVEHAPYAIYKTSVDSGRFISVNPALVAMLGYESAAEVLALDVATQVYSDPASRARLLPELQQQERFSNVELEWKRKDGKPLLLRLSGRLTQDGDGEKFFEAIAEDITERKRGEAERARLAAAIEQSNEIVLIVGLKGEIEFANPAFTGITGYSREEVLGHNLRFLKSGKHDQAYYKSLWDTILAGEIWRGEIINRKKDGSLYTQRMTITPVRDGAGKLANFIAICDDITERKRAEEALQRSEEDFRSLVTNAPYGICRANEDGSRLTAVNPAVVRMLGYSSEEEVLALNLATDLLSSPTELARVVEKVSQKEGFQHLETAWRRKDGKMVTVHGSGRAVRDGAGMLRFEWIVEDVTATREMEQQLRQAQKMEAVGRLAGGIAHDFNNLLTVIRGYAELMLEETDREKLRSRAQNIIKASDRTAALTRQLLAFSRKQVLWPQVLDPNAVVAETQKMLPPLIGEDVRLVVIPDPKLGRVKADPGQLEQVLMNLVINARDAMPKGGKLVLETANVECDESYCALHPGAQPGAYVMMGVSDNGCGMDAETQAHIFEPFFTTKEKDKGTGLGLATVYGIVKQSGGHIWAYSEPGVGTTFKVYLPRVEAEGAAVPRLPRLQERADGTETILLVEDEESLRGVAREFLEQHGYHVLEACNGAEALEVAAAQVAPIHLLLTDIVMPGMRGQELAEKLCSSRPQVKVLFVSGYTDGSIVENGELGPGSAFLEKPFTSDSLARKVRQVLDSATSGGEPPAGPHAAAPAKEEAGSPAVRLENK